MLRLSRRRLGALFGAAFAGTFFWAGVAAAQTGIEVRGATADASPPYACAAHEGGTGKPVKNLSNTWGLLQVKPGEYEVRLQWQYGEPVVPYARLKVEEGKVAKLVVDTGLSLSGRDRGAPFSCKAYPAAGGQPVAEVKNRWGFTPLPPGEYQLGVVYFYGEKEVRFPRMKVERGQTLPVALEAGLELAGRDGKEGAPFLSRAYPAGGGQPVAEIKNRWGFTPLPPGEYQLGVVYRYSEKEVRLPPVKVEEGKATRMALETGLELTGRDEKEGVPYHWKAYPAGGGGPAVEISGRWGFTPLPPGEYQVAVVYRYLEKEVRFPSVKVEAGKAARVALETGLELAGANEKEEAPFAWQVYPAGGGKPAAEISRRWGFTPLPPGEYQVGVVYRYSEKEMRFPPVKVEEAKTSRVALATGLELAGGAEKEDAPFAWSVYPAGSTEPAAAIGRRWGFTPLRAGTYEVGVVYRYGEREVRLASVKVDDGQVVRVIAATGLELAARSPAEEAPFLWTVYRGGGEKITEVSRRWGFTPLVPGKYEVGVVYRYSERETRLPPVNVEAGRALRVVLDTGVELSGRSKTEEAPFAWSVSPAAGGEPAVTISRRWGFTPLPAGDYEVKVVPAYQENEIRLAKVSVQPGGVLSLRLDTGIELAPSTPGQAAPDTWSVQDEQTKAEVARARQRFGFTPLPPGTYGVEALAGGKPFGAARNVAVKAGEVTKISLAAGGAASEKAPPPPPGGFEVHVQAEDTINVLSWAPPPGKTVAGYRVYRAGTPRPIHGQEPLTSTKFTDLGLSNGRTYAYVVVAVLPDGTEWKAYRQAEGTPAAR